MLNSNVLAQFGHKAGAHTCIPRTLAHEPSLSGRVLSLNYPPINVPRVKMKVSLKQSKQSLAFGLNRSKEDLRGVEWNELPSRPFMHGIC